MTSLHLAGWIACVNWVASIGGCTCRRRRRFRPPLSTAGADCNAKLRLVRRRFSRGRLQCAGAAVGICPQILPRRIATADGIEPFLAGPGEAGITRAAPSGDQSRGDAMGLFVVHAREIHRLDRASRASRGTQAGAAAAHDGCKQQRVPCCSGARNHVLPESCKTRRKPVRFHVEYTARP